MRIGQGYDVHRLCEGRPLILGGVPIAYERGLDGHSDADVLTHAVMDAILGALGMGDIGRWFPDSDERYRGADSLQLLGHVARWMEERGYAVCNVDATIVAQKPRLAEFLPRMEQNLSRVLGGAPVNVKATTEEGLGFTGSGQGMAAQAVCLLIRT